MCFIRSSLDWKIDNDVLSIDSHRTNNELLKLKVLKRRILLLLLVK